MFLRAELAFLFELQSIALEYRWLNIYINRNENVVLLSPMWLLFFRYIEQLLVTTLRSYLTAFLRKYISGMMATGVMAILPGHFDCNFRYIFSQTIFL